MAKAGSYKDVEFAVDDASGRERIFKNFDEAVAFAVSISLSGGQESHVDILVHSESGAKALFGEGGVEEYREDPDASVFKRLSISVEDRGRVY